MNSLFYSAPAGRSTAQDTSPGTPQGTFSGHDTFVFRYAWLKKGVDAARADPHIFSAEAAVATLGVGKNMVRSIRHWCLATKLLADTEGRNGVTPTPLANFLLEQADPYLEHDGSLWLLHWHLATNPRRAPTWYWAFNICRDMEGTRESFQQGLTRWAEGQGWTRLSASTLKSDVAVFLRTYAAGRRGPASTPEETLDCPLVALGLLTKVEKKDDESGERFRFNFRPKPTLPAAVFAFALVEFWQGWHAASPALSLREITHGEGSPGRVFRLDEDGVLEYLDRLGALTHDRLSFTDTALVRQVTRHVPVETIDPQKFLHDYYKL